MDKDDVFLAKIKDAKVKAEFNNKMTLFRFLDLHQQELITYHMGKDIFVYFDSGFTEGEYKRCIVSPFEIEPNFKITILEVIYDQRYVTLGHRNILGGILSFGIERNVIGDIVSDGKRFYVACIEEMKEFLIKQAIESNVRFRLEEVNNTVLSLSEEYDVKMYFVKSLRVDSCISMVYGLSRNESYNLITNGFVKINHVECLNPSKHVDVMDVISVRTKGRIKVFFVDDTTTRSGRIKVKLGRL